MKLSRGFVCMLVGFGLTVFGWFGPWEWPDWPGLFVLTRFFGGDYAGFANPKRALVLLLLIVVNTGTWALVTYAVISAFRAVRGKREEVEETPE